MTRPKSEPWKMILVTARSDRRSESGLRQWKAQASPPSARQPVSAAVCCVQLAGILDIGDPGQKSIAQDSRLDEGCRGKDQPMGTRCGLNARNPKRSEAEVVSNTTEYYEL